MAIPRPKILTAVTIPTGGWQFRFYLSDAAQYDTTKTVTLAAGDYFVSGDNQSDDFLFQLATQVQAALTGNFAGVDFMADINATTHKVDLKFDQLTDATPPLNDTKLAWTEVDGASIAAVLGFDSSADDVLTAEDHPVFTADWQHGYGWYADEDGLLANLFVEDVSEATTLQSRALSGKVKTQRISASLYSNSLELDWVPRGYMFSNGVGYGAANVQPYERNRGLECWWLDAINGTRFRVYRDGLVDTTKATDGGESTGGTTTTLVDSGKAWDIDPQQFAGRVFHIPTFSAGGTAISQRFYVSSHTATTLTVPNAHPSGLQPRSNDATYYVFEHPYQTYVVDTSDMSEFAPDEIPAIDRYKIKIPLLRYI